MNKKPRNDEPLEPEPKGEEASKGDYEDYDPLKGGLGCYPEREQILRLARSPELNNIRLDGLVPDPTVRDVIVSAMNSVKFLEELGDETITSKDVGIDHAGRLCVRPGWVDMDLRNDFHDAVVKIRGTLSRRQAVAKLRPYMEAIVEDNWILYVIDAGYKETNALLSSIDDLMCASRFDLDGLEKLSAVRKQAVVELEEIANLLILLKHDLLETGTTTVSRWNRLKSMDTRYWREACSETGDLAGEDGRQKLIEKIDGLHPDWQKLMVLVMNLEAPLEEAIREFKEANSPSGRPGDFV